MLRPWVQQAGGWASAKMLLDVHGHSMPSETPGYADRLTPPDGPHTAPAPMRARDRLRKVGGKLSDSLKKLDTRRAGAREASRKSGLTRIDPA